jgi:hypothetical protein
MRSSLGVSIVWLCFAACGGGVDVSTNSGNVCSEIAKVACHDLYQCCSEGEIEGFLRVSEPRTEPQCKEDVTRLCEREVALLDESIDKKRVRFDSELMNNCLDALVAPSNACATVEASLPWTEECMNSAWIGLVPDGGQCFGSFECASKDSFCAPNQICTAKPTNGQPCTGGVDSCATGFYCQTTCRPQVGAGQQCSFTQQCTEPLICDATSLTCTNLHETGEPCTSNAACKSQRCLPGTCAGTTTPCFNSAACGLRCTNNGNTCFQDSGCGVPGRCSFTTTTMCTTFSNPCTALGETCIFPQLCQPSTCVGTPVCGEAQRVTDYCEDALEDFPVIGTN